MIYGIGVDIVQVSRMQANLNKHGDRFAERILGESEMAEYDASNKKPHFLAKRFAAKEAIAKALGTGFRDGLSLSQITISHNDEGKPLIDFHAKALVLKLEQGIGDSHISLSDEKDYAVAFVTLMKS